MPNQYPMAFRSICPVAWGAQDLPPFWDLEQLVLDGFDRDEALEELARRRACWPDHSATRSGPQRATVIKFTIAS